MGYSRKKNRGRGLRTFFFLLYSWKFKTKQSSTPGNSTKLGWMPWKFQGQKPRPLALSLEILHYFFLVTLGNATLFLISLWKFHKFHMLFLWDPWKVHIFNPPPVCLFFFWNSPIALASHGAVHYNDSLVVFISEILIFTKNNIFIYIFFYFYSHNSEIHSKTIFAVERSDFGIDKPDALCNLSLLGHLTLW